MAVIVRRGVPVNPSLPFFCVVLVTCVQCQAQYYVEQTDVTYPPDTTPRLFVYHAAIPGIQLPSIYGSCPQCAWPSVLINGDSSVDQTLVGTAGTASDLWQWATDHGFAGVRYLYSEQEDVVVALALDANNAAIPSRNHPADPNYSWAIRRASPSLPVAIGLDFYTLLPGEFIPPGVANVLDPQLVTFLAREGVVVLE